MSLFSNSRRFKRFIIAMGKFSPGIYHPTRLILETADGEVWMNTGRVSWIVEDESGNVRVDPDASNGRIVDDVINDVLKVLVI